MTFEEAKKYLEFAPVGVFLVRFSGSRPGSFAIDYVTFSTPPVAEERYGAIPDPQTIGLTFFEFIFFLKKKI